MASGDGAEAEESSRASKTPDYVPDDVVPDESADSEGPQGMKEPNVTADATDMQRIDSQPATSQPMTASNSTSSNPSSAKDTASGPSPYGTRSRNRTGTSRINYAEDKEMDFETQVPIKEEEGKRSSRNDEAQSAPGAQGIGQGSSSRRGAAASIESVAASIQNGSKDQIPGTSTFSASLAPSAPAQPPKKTRKAAQNGGANNSGSGSQSVTRRGSISTQVMNGLRDSCMLTFDDCNSMLKGDKLIADDGTVLNVNDHAYLVCEPPGEPYYLGRIMEFVHVDNDRSNPVESVRMNWYYRAKDIGRRTNDTRQVFATMHQDVSPLTSLRGKCEVRHKSEVPNMDEYRRQQNNFWFEKMYDRYIHKYFEVVPTSAVVNVPTKVKRVLDERWRYILVESGRGKELTSASKSCKRCSGFCASNDSVDCAVCRQTYHMNCVRPPLLKKPSRGFAWACGPCSRAQERKMQERNVPTVKEAGADVEDEEVLDDDDDHHLLDDSGTGLSTPDGLGDSDLSIHPGTEEQIYEASLWPYRYLGIHCRVEDALDYDDRIHPRAGSRLGPRHQADVPAWAGQPFEYVRPMEIRKKYLKGSGHKKDTKLSKDTIAAMEADKLARDQRPKWVVDEPPGYQERGLDLDNDDPNNTATLLFKPLDSDKESQDDNGMEDGTVDAPEMEIYKNYMERAGPFAEQLGLTRTTTNWMDKAINILWANDFNVEASLRKLYAVKREELNQPDFSPAEIKKFEDGVAKHGSELIKVKKHVKTVSPGDIVRFYYVWKKSDRGKQVWGKHGSRKGKKDVKSLVKLQDDVAHDLDDSAFDNEKAAEKKRGFQCKFCFARTSRQWRRAPNTVPGTTVPVDPANKTKEKSSQLIVALCINCAIVWRKYAVQWEEGERNFSLGIGRGGKRKAEDPLREFQLNEMNMTAQNTDAANTPNAGTPVPQVAPVQVGQEPPRKKLKGNVDKATPDPAALDSGGVVTAGTQKKKVVEKPAGPPPVEEIPKPKTLPCAVCLEVEPVSEHLSCKECRLAVHRNCYGAINGGVVDARGVNKWTCDTCVNDRNPSVSVQYNCVLCPVRYTLVDFVQHPKITHTTKKKSEKDREKERLERENNERAAHFYRMKQIEMHRPVDPREALKTTSSNNWVHVTCAIWTPDVKFGNAKALKPSENIGLQGSRYDETCVICKTSGAGACVSCHTCKVSVHIGCAHQHGFFFGFDVNPVKGSRRDAVNTVLVNGETISMTAAIWCPKDAPVASSKTRFYRMHDIIDDTGINALQLYVQNFKQADSTLSGTVRKASHISQSTKTVPASIAVAVSPTVGPGRRSSTLAASARRSDSIVKQEEILNGLSAVAPAPAEATEQTRHCVTCETDVTPKWWPYSEAPSRPATSTGNVESLEQQMTNGNSTIDADQDTPQDRALASAAFKELSISKPSEDAVVETQCHKCHFNKVAKKIPSPPPPPPAPISIPVAVPISSIMTNVLSDMLSAQPAYSAPTGAPVIPPAPMASPIQREQPAPPRYQPWGSATTFSPPAPPSYVGPWNGRSPNTGQAQIPQYSSNQSPYAPLASPYNMQQQAPRPSSSLDHSPRLNGIIQPPTNGYPHPQHRSVSTAHPNAQPTYPSYSAQMPSPHLLTNGGPPSRAPNHPYAQSSHVPMSRPSPYGPLHGSPPPAREMPMRDPRGPRDPSSQGRVNGGASASPSLQNLLH